MTAHEIQQKYFEKTGNTSIYNIGGGVSLEYVYWLENKLTESGIEIL